MTAAVLVALAFTPGATLADDPDCAMCHENLAKAFEATIHGRIQGFETNELGVQVGCISCHGDGTEHMDSGGETDKIRGFGPDAPPELETEVCMTCHRSHALNDWVGSEHPLNGVGCADCHKVHAPHEEAVKYSENCMSCHPEVQAQMNLPSRHPVREGKMDCQSCHTPHGSSIGLVNSDIDVMDLCLTCHAEYSGPFIFEHSPVSEGCDTCHEPHGTIANNLLQQNEPFICLQCHELHFHAGLEGWDEDEVQIQAYEPRLNPNSPYEDGMVPNNGPSSYRQAFTTKCTQCHTMVHGTDLPSQTVPGRGDGLMR